MIEIYYSESAGGAHDFRLRRRERLVGWSCRSLPVGCIFVTGGIARKHQFQRPTTSPALPIKGQLKVD